MKICLYLCEEGQRRRKTCLIVCNFSPLVYENHKIGVPYNGKYKEIFNSDSKEFGGDGNVNPRAKSSKKSPCDDREDSIQILVPPMGISIFQCTRTAEKAAAGHTTKRAAKTTEAVKAAPKRRGRKKKRLAAEADEGSGGRGAEGNRSLR